MAKARGSSFGRTEDAIVAAAGELFDRKGFNQTSLQDIADALGMARPSLYHYFNNREQILAVGIERLTKQRDAMTEGLREIGGDPSERLPALMLGLGTFVRENPVWVRVALREEAALPDTVRVRDRESRTVFFELLLSALREGVELGYLRACDERATAVTIISALAGLKDQYVATTDASLEETTGLAVDIIMHGVLSPSRRQGTLLEQGLQLIRDGAELIERGSTREASSAMAHRRERQPQRR